VAERSWAHFYLGGIFSGSMHGRIRLDEYVVL
jgi:hypothetical protein